MDHERCPICDGSALAVSEERDVQIGKRTARVLDEFFRCGVCGEEFYLPGQMTATQQRASARIREEEGLLAPSEIRALREDLGLTQHAFEALLGVGPKTVVRWERGTVFQNRATDALLRVLREFPEAAAFLAERGGVELRPLTHRWGGLLHKPSRNRIS